MYLSRIRFIAPARLESSLLRTQLALHTQFRTSDFRDEHVKDCTQNTNVAKIYDFQLSPLEVSATESVRMSFDKHAGFKIRK